MWLEDGKEQSLLLLLLVQDAGSGNKGAVTTAACARRWNGPAAAPARYFTAPLLALLLLSFSFCCCPKDLKPNFGETLSKGVLRKTTFKLSISVVKVLKKSSNLFLSDRGDFGRNLSERPEIGTGIF